MNTHINIYTYACSMLYIIKLNKFNKFTEISILYLLHVFRCLYFIQFVSGISLRVDPPLSTIIRVYRVC